MPNAGEYSVGPQQVRPLFERYSNGTAPPKHRPGNKNNLSSKQGDFVIHMIEYIGVRFPFLPSFTVKWAPPSSEKANQYFREILSSAPFFYRKGKRRSRRYLEAGLVAIALLVLHVALIHVAATNLWTRALQQKLPHYSLEKEPRNLLAACRIVARRHPSPLR